MSEQIESAVWGITPWSDELLIISGDVERGRLEPSTQKEQARQDAFKAEEVQRQAGIDLVSADWGGQSIDYFRSIARAADGFAPGVDQAPVTRWFETNTFYRQPTIEDRLYMPTQTTLDTRAVGTVGDLYAGNVLLTLLSPHAFNRLAARGNHISESQGAAYVGQLYDELFDQATKNGHDEVLLHEPLAAYEKQDEPARQRLWCQLESLAKNHPELTTHVYLSNGDAGDLLQTYTERGTATTIPGVGCDVTRSSLPKVSYGDYLCFWAGAVDGANSLIEADNAIASRLRRVEESIAGGKLVLTHTIDLEHLPFDTALQKVAQIGRLADRGIL